MLVDVVDAGAVVALLVRGADGWVCGTTKPFTRIDTASCVLNTGVGAARVPRARVGCPCIGRARISKSAAGASLRAVLIRAVDETVRVVVDAVETVFGGGDSSVDGVVDGVSRATNNEGTGQGKEWSTHESSDRFGSGVKPSSLFDVSQH